MQYGSQETACNEISGIILKTACFDFYESHANIFEGCATFLESRPRYSGKNHLCVTFSPPAGFFRRKPFPGKTPAVLTCMSLWYLEFAERVIWLT
jgi:hypothetical protein